jgi:hypothetical protein
MQSQRAQTAPRILRLKTDSPAAHTLAIMGKNATEAARTWTMREWAARLATKAGPRDYVGQLRALYQGILDRWRYVQEPGEWVYGKPRALLGFCLGANYNQGPSCPDPERCDVEATSWRERGFGDCDDVAQLAAAGALALGMTPVIWRVAQWPKGAHVSAVARTPRGEWVSIDPVGHPTHGFGWALEPQGGQVRWFDLRGRPTHAPRARPGAKPMPATYYSGPEETSYETVRKEPSHVVLTEPGDARGARTLGIPLWHHNLMLRGAVIDGTPAIDQFGDQYEYDSGNDVWVPLGRWRPFRRLRKRFARARKRVRRIFKKTRVGRAVLRAGKRIRKGVRRVAAAVGRSRVAQLFRRAKAKILSNRIVQGIAANALQALGVPRAATRAVLEREAEIARRGGRAKLVELLAAGNRKGARDFMIKTIKAAGRGAIPPMLRKQLMKSKKVRQMLSGPDALAEGQEMVMVQDGAMYTVAPVEQLSGICGVDLGQIDAKNTVEPGTFYKIQKGDTLLEIGQALNDGKRKGGPFGSRLGAAKVINASQYNQKFHRPSKEGFETKYIGPTIISLNPRGEWGGLATIWIPPSPGVEPPPICPSGQKYDMAANVCLPIPEPPAPPPPEPPVVPPPAPPPPPIVPKPEPKPTPAPTPTPTPPPPPPVERPCPEWFFRHPDSGICRPVVAPGGPGCPDGMEWDSEHGLLGGCVPVAPPPTPTPTPTPKPTPKPLPTPTPKPAPTCPEGQVWNKLKQQCVQDPAACPPGTVYSVKQGRCVQVVPPPTPTPTPTPTPKPPPDMPLPPPTPQPAKGMPWWPLAVLFAITS